MDARANRKWPVESRSIDRHIGARLRARRLTVGMSQEKLGGLLGITFQQIQKYEKGLNRVSSGRLLRIADVLGVNYSYFLAGAPEAEAMTGEGRAAQQRIGDFIGSKEGVSIIAAWTKITPAQRRIMAELIQSLVPEEGSTE